MDRGCARNMSDAYLASTTSLVRGKGKQQKWKNQFVAQMSMLLNNWKLWCCYNIGNELETLVSHYKTSLKSN